MSSWQCGNCRTVYPLGIPRCASCEAKEAAAVAHANVHGSTHYVGENDPLPSDLHPEVRLVGPGAPAVAEPERVVTLALVDELIDKKIASTHVAYDPPDDADDDGEDDEPDDDPEDYAGQTILALRDLCRQRGLPVAGAKAELVVRLHVDDLAKAGAA